jgi:hypothetical protein
MPRVEIERGGFLQLAKGQNLSFESKKKRIGGSGQRSFLSASAALRGAKDFRRTESIGISRRAQIGGFFDEKAIFGGD